MTLHIAFHAPLKPPDHPVPSGDREMARLYLRALALAGFAPEIASRLRTRDGEGGADFAPEAETEIRRLLQDYQGQIMPRPDIWFTYHVYYKAPDLIGPAIARALDIPYVIAEGSRAPKRADGPWAGGNAQAEAALDAADLLLIPNPQDRPMLEKHRPPQQALVDFPPFIDDSAWPAHPRRPRADICRLLTVAMMREGDKLASYRLLAEALGHVRDLSWRLDIVGDGPARAAIEALFAPFGHRIAFLGQIESRDTLAGLYAQADMLLWPAVNEAFGMVFLEAALQGCPAIAGNSGGVRTVVSSGKTGLLTSPGDVAGFARAVRSLIGDEALRLSLCDGAAAFAREERSLAGAADRLREILRTAAVRFRT